MNKIGRFLSSSLLVLTLVLSCSVTFLPEKSIDVQAYTGPHLEFTYTFPTDGNKMVIKVTNDGSTDISNMYIWAGWDAGNNKVYSQNKIGPLYLKSNYYNTYTVYLTPPNQGTQTRGYVQLWADGFNTFQSYGSYVTISGGTKQCTGPHMSFTKPVYMVNAAVVLDDGQAAYFTGSHSFLVSAGTHHWDMWGYNYEGHVYHWSGTGTAYDCRPYSFIAG